MPDHLSGGSAPSAHAGGTMGGGNAQGGSRGDSGAGQPNPPAQTIDNDFQQLTQEQLYALNERTQGIASENEQLKATLERLRGALGGEDPRQAQQPQGPDLGWYDDILRLAFEAEKQGKSMPITVDLATRTRGIVAENHELRQQLQQIQNQVKHLSNPETLNNQRVYENLDNEIFNQIEGAYGKVDENLRNYVSSEVGKAIKTLQKDHPEAWTKVRGSQQLQQRLVQNALRNTLPAPVREKLRDDYLANSEMSLDELAQAWAEANQIEDPELRRKVKAEARQRYWEAQAGSKKGESFQGRVSRFMR